MVKVSCQSRTVLRQKAQKKGEARRSDISPGAQDGGWNEMIFVEPSRSSGNLAKSAEKKARVVVAIGHDPTNVGPEETEERGGVDVIVLVGEAVMMTVVGGPPEDAFLGGSHSHEGDYELEYATGFVGAMREIPVIAGGDPEHPDRDEGYAGDQIGPAKRNEENAQGEQVHYGERSYADQGDAGAVWQGDRQRSCR